VTLLPIADISGSPTSAEVNINANNAAIVTALDNTLSRDGTTPNTMGSNLDMNSHRITNLPYALTDTEPVTLAQMNAASGVGVHTHVVADITDYVSATNLLINAAIGSISASGVSNGDKGDITVTGGGVVWTIDAGVVSTTKLGGDITAAGKALLDDADATAQRATLGLGTAATSASGAFATAAHNHNATEITAGLLADARLNTTIPRYADTTANFTGDLQIGGLTVATKVIPQNSQSANYTCVLTDSGKHIYHPIGGGAGHVFTIPANASVAYPIGTAITFVNMDNANSISIAITTDTMYLAGPGTTGTRTLGTFGQATALKITSTAWLISGTDLT
jgi:hypothetical protein